MFFICTSISKLHSKFHCAEIATTILEHVNKATVNFQDSFTYTINASLYDITDIIRSAKITTFIPNYINYFLPSIVPPLESISKSVKNNGTLITFNFSSTSEASNSIVLNIPCKFKMGTKNNTTFISTSTLYVNNEFFASSTPCNVTLKTTGDFSLSKSLVSPATYNPAPGSTLVYQLNLTNILKEAGGHGDLGAGVNNAWIVDYLPDDLRVDPTFTPIGTDTSGIDSKYNNCKGIVDTASNSISFYLPKYYGTNYQVTFRCILNPNASIGDTLVNKAAWYINDIKQNEAISTCKVSSPSYYVAFSKFGPVHGSPGNKISYILSTMNYCNLDLHNVVIEDSIPSDVTVTSLKTGSFYMQATNTFISGFNKIEYLINHKEPYILLGNYNQNNSEFVKLPLLKAGEKITKIRWTFENFPVCVQTFIDFNIIGVINSDITSKEITNVGTLHYYQGNELSSIHAIQKTYIDGKSEIDASKSCNSSVTYYGNTLNYELKLNAKYSQIDEPIIVDLLPLQIEYLNLSSSIYADYLENIYLDPFPVNIDTIANFADTGRTLIRFTFNKGFHVTQNGVLTLNFSTKVKDGSMGTIKNLILIGNETSSVIPSPNERVYIDTNNMTGNKHSSEELIESNITYTDILSSISITSNKFVQGELDSKFLKFPSIASTVAGGKIDYKLIITNSGTIDIENIEIIDILPHIDDTSVLNSEKRGSEFTIYNISEINAELSPLYDTSHKPELKLQYSTSYDPIRFSSIDISSNNSTSKLIGTGSWANNIPIPVTETAAFKLTTINTKLSPKQSLIIRVTCIAPIGISPKNVAWNSFALRASYYNKNNILSYLLPIETQKVGIEIKSPPLYKCKLGGYVWLDLNHDGIYDSGDPGINGVKINLYNEKTNAILDFTYTTTNTLTGKPGYYLFNNLEGGNYYLEFIKPKKYKFTIQNETSTPNITSKVNPTTGKTSIIHLNPGESNLNVDGGLFIPAKPCPYESSIDDIIESIALEETAIANIITNEGEKIKKFISLNPNTKELLEIDCSVNETLRGLTELELILVRKIDISKSICDPCKS